MVRDGLVKQLREITKLGYMEFYKIKFCNLLPNTSLKS